MQIKASTTEEYLNQLTDERKEIISELLKIIRANIPNGYKETAHYGALCFIVPEEKFFDEKNNQPLSYFAIGSQKNHIGLYHNCYEPIPEWFLEEYKSSGKRMDVGKCCIRFKKLEHLPLESLPKLFAQHSVDQFIEVFKNSTKTKSKK